MSVLRHRYCTSCRLLLISLLAALCSLMPARVLADCDPDGDQATGAVYRICMPALARWNGDLVVYAHGYVDPGRPIEIPDEQLTLPGGSSIPQVVNLLGYGFAATSFSTNGLAIREGVDDLVDLVHVFADSYGSPARVYLIGVSEGALVATLSLERHPDFFDGGLAACGPIGDFRKQLEYMGNFRILFDYYFPGVLPGSIVEIPQDVVDNWEDAYVAAILDAIRADPDGLAKLLRVSAVPTDAAEGAMVEAAVQTLLWYSVYAGADVVDKLGGQAFGNVGIRYHGGGKNALLNRAVDRVAADAAALEEIEFFYQASGALTSPLVTLHTAYDPVTPHWHEQLYRRKVFQAGGQPFLANVIVDRFGHCNFTAVDLLVAFSVLVWEVAGEELVGVDGVLGRGKARADFMKKVRMYGVGS